jgi:hypothetical protein
MSANVRVAQVAGLQGVGLEPAVAPGQVAAGTVLDCLLLALGLAANEGAVAHDAATIAARQSGSDRSLASVRSRDRVIVEG